MTYPQQPLQQPQQQQQAAPPVTGTWQYTEEVAASVPVGQYAAAFAGFNPCDTEFGPKLRLMWTITSGELQGQTASTLVGIPKGKLNPQHTLYHFAIAFLNRQLAEGEAIDFNQFVGTPGTVIVSPTQTGKSTKVTAFLPSPQQTLQPQLPQVAAVPQPIQAAQGNGQQPQATAPMPPPQQQAAQPQPVAPVSMQPQQQAALQQRPVAQQFSEPADSAAAKAAIADTQQQGTEVF